MNDSEFIQSLKNTTDPIEALKLIVENEHLLGYDPYYSDLRIALLAMAERIVKQTNGDQDA
jgi:hypothetical protein